MLRIIVRLPTLFAILSGFRGSFSPALPHALVFEDNTETAYFYGLSTEPNQQVLDALHIYDVGKVIDKNKVCKIQIAWTGDGSIASLLINDYCHVIFTLSIDTGSAERLP